MSAKDYIQPSYRFAEVNRLMKLPLSEKIKIAVTVIGQALKLSRHTAAIAFSGGTTY